MKEEKITIIIQELDSIRLILEELKKEVKSGI